MMSDVSALLHAVIDCEVTSPGGPTRTIDDIRIPDDYG
jgi:hypothetical protein